MVIAAKALLFSNSMRLQAASTAHLWMERVACVQGIVTAIDGGGFYLQEILPDDDPRTSEGIYVDLKALPK